MSANTTLTSDKKSFLYYFDKYSYVFFFLIVALTFTKLLVLSFLTPFYADDFARTQDNTGISFSVYFDWLTTSVSQADFIRFTPHLIIHSLSMLSFSAGLVALNILNAVFYTALTLLIYFYANCALSSKKNTLAKKYNVPLYFLSVAFLWLFIPGFGDGVLWLSGRPYMWTAAIVLAFLFPYVRLASTGADFKGNVLSIIAMTIFGFFTGVAMESFSGGAALAAILLTIYCITKKIKLRGWMFGGLIGIISGVILQITSYGVRDRFGFLQRIHAESINQTPEISGASETVTSGGFDFILSVFPGGFGNITRYVYEHFTVLIIIFIILFTLMIVTRNDKNRAWISLIFVFSSIATLYVMAFIGGIGSSHRVALLPAVFLIIACLYCYTGISFDKKMQKSVNAVFISVMAYFFIITSVLAIGYMHVTKTAHDMNSAFIIRQIELGNLDISVPKLPDPQSRHDPLYGREYGFYLSNSPEWWTNRSMARHYGADSIAAFELCGGRRIEDFRRAHARLHE